MGGTRRETARVEPEEGEVNERRTGGEKKERNTKMTIENGREKLVLDHLFMLETIGRQVHYGKLSHVEQKELQQDGAIGLLEAVDRFDPRKGAFQPFAYSRVRGAMIDPHKGPNYLNETHTSLEGIEERLGFLPASVISDKGPLPDEIAERLELKRLFEKFFTELQPDDQCVFAAALRSKSLVETARECGRTVAWVRARRASVYARLRARVHKRGLRNR